MEFEKIRDFKEESLKAIFSESSLGTCVEIAEIEKLDEKTAEFEGTDELKRQTIFLDFDELEWVFEKYLEYKRFRGIAIDKSKLKNEILNLFDGDSNNLLMWISANFYDELVNLIDLSKSEIEKLKKARDNIFKGG